MMLLNGLSRSEFLTTYWQKKPLLIPEAFADFNNPVSKEELIELACDEDIESRIIQKQESSWQLRHGSFNHEDFLSLTESLWTLLVQSVDQHVPEVADLLQHFDFIPNWRVDDIMLSYAPIHGSVGPHLDNYDVFLLQAQGQRHWYINESDYSEENFIKGLDLRIIDNFESKNDWVLNPGDMLYLPPGVAHHGIALNDCITISIGFRAPTQMELLTAFVDNVSADQKSVFYTDPELTLQKYPGEISIEHIESIRQFMVNTLTDKEDFRNWFGHYITDDLKEVYESETSETFKDFEILFKQQSILHREGRIRISYIQQDKSIDLFYAGHHKQLTMDAIDFVRYLSSNRQVEYSEILDLPNQNLALNMLHQMYKHGYFYFSE